MTRAEMITQESHKMIVLLLMSHVSIIRSNDFHRKNTFVYASSELKQSPLGNQLIHLLKNVLLHLFRARISLSIQVSTVMINCIQRETVF